VVLRDVLVEAHDVNSGGGRVCTKQSLQLGETSRIEQDDIQANRCGDPKASRSW
jgi:hypothetical protein